MSDSHHGRGAVALLTAAFVVAAASQAQAASPLHVSGRHLRDAAGRVITLRGVNVAGNAKVPPFVPAADPAIFDPLPGWGMNVVRLLFTWEAYEPSKGKYESAYLDYYLGAVRAASERGLYVIVDIHQDGFARGALGGCGDGFPAWALPATVTAVPPDNGPACADWGFKLLSDEDQKVIWQAFHADAEGARTRYLAMLESVSERLADEPGVIGYDLMNEPQGDELSEIGPLYEDAASAVRKASPTAIVFVSPHARTSAGSQTELERPSFDNLVYAPHFYDASVLFFGSWSGVVPDTAFANMNGKAAEWEVPLFLGEFGAPGGTVDGDLYVDEMYSQLDSGLSSGAQWTYSPGWTETAKDGWNDEDFSIVDGAGETRPNFRVRPFAAAIAGTPTLFQARRDGAPEDREIELAWEHDPAAGLTEVFVPAQAFFETRSVVVETSGEGLTCSFAGSFVRCFSPDAGPMRIVVRAAPASEPGRCGLTGIELLLLWPLSLVARRRRKRTRAEKPTR